MKNYFDFIRRFVPQAIENVVGENASWKPHCLEFTPRDVIICAFAVIVSSFFISGVSGIFSPSASCFFSNSHNLEVIPIGACSCLDPGLQHLS